MKHNQILAFLIPFVIVGTLSSSTVYVYGDHNPKESYDQAPVDHFQPLHELVISLVIWFGVPGLLAGGIGCAIYSKRSSQNLESTAVAPRIINSADSSRSM